jgi:hypothetical protein
LLIQIHAGAADTRQTLARPPFLDQLRLGPAVRELASVLLSSEAGMDAAESSALHWLRLAAAAGGVLRLLSVDNQSFRECSVSLLEAMLAEANVELQLSCPVRRIEQTADRVSVVTDAECFEARTAVVTIPRACWAKSSLNRPPPLADLHRGSNRERVPRRPRDRRPACHLILGPAFVRCDRMAIGSSPTTAG